MLVLTRKIGERVRLKVGDDGPEIWVMLVDLDRGKCRIGFDCPRDVVITRQELLSPSEQPTPTR